MSQKEEYFPLHSSFTEYQEKNSMFDRRDSATDKTVLELDFWKPLKQKKKSRM